MLRSLCSDSELMWKRPWFPLGTEPQALPVHRGRLPVLVVEGSAAFQLAVSAK